METRYEVFFDNDQVCTKEYDCETLGEARQLAEELISKGNDSCLAYIFKDNEPYEYYTKSSGRKQF